MVFRRRRDEPDPTPAVAARWRADIDAAHASRRRFDTIVDRVPAGPLRDRLAELGGDVVAVVAGVEAAAVRADRLSATLGDLDVDRLTDALKDARRDLARAAEDGRDVTDLRSRAESLDRQLGSVHSVWDAVDAAADELHRLQLQLGESVALAGVIATHPEAQASAEVVDMRADLRALRAALDDLAN